MAFIALVAISRGSSPKGTTLDGFSAKNSYSGGHDDGPTSVEEALGKLYVTDRTTVTLVMADPSINAIATSTPLASGPDYVRFVDSTNELWVTEPSADQIEIFTLGNDGTPTSDATMPPRSTRIMM